MRETKGNNNKKYIPFSTVLSAFQGCLSPFSAFRKTSVLLKSGWQQWKTIPNAEKCQDANLRADTLKLYVNIATATNFK